MTLSKSPAAVAKRSWRLENPEAAKAAAAKWRSKNREKRKAVRRRDKYGLDQETYQQMVLLQGGRCAICSLPELVAPKGLHVDHDHRTGAVRALLCGPCNTGLGLFRESPETLRMAAAYSEHFR